MSTGISWADETWNPFVGCRAVSPACANCYAQDMAARIVRMEAGLGRLSHYALTVRPTPKGAAWTGHIARAPHKARFAPFGLKRPRDIFVCSMSDFFHAGAPDEWRIEALAIMALTPRHQYLLLTKRAADMRRFMSSPATARAVWDKAAKLAIERNLCFARIEDMLVGGWPLPNVALGVTAEDQARADERCDDLEATPAAKRFVSYEPALGPIDLRRWLKLTPDNQPLFFNPPRDHFDWVICGGESGSNARPMSIQWARELRDQCAAAAVPFFFKQWGEWAPARCRSSGEPGKFVFGDYEFDRTAWSFSDFYPRQFTMFGSRCVMERLGLRRAGHLLDGVEHHARPFSRSAPAAAHEHKEAAQ